MDLNIDPLLNMTFDENGINDFFNLYENKIDQELHLLNSISFIQKKINQNKELLNYEDYDKINEDVLIYSKMFELKKVLEQFYSLSKELQTTLSVFLKDKESDLTTTQDVNKKFSEFLVQIKECCLEVLSEIDWSGLSLLNRSIFKTFQKEVSEKIYFSINSQAEIFFIPPNIEMICNYIQTKTNLPLLK